MLKVIGPYLLLQWWEGSTMEYYYEVYANIPQLKHIDALAILDCCFASSERNTSIRSMQILAASGPFKPSRAQTAGVSFTQLFTALQ
jgi:hypothetical protein